MHISDRGVALIAGFEGFSSRSYWDPYGRVWTIGFGQTEGVGPNTPPMTRAQGEANIRRLVEERYEPSIRALGVDFNQDQWDALCSFAWNLGAGIFTGSLRAALQARDWRRAGQLMLEYDHAGGVVLAGLRSRREAEVRLFLSGPAPDPLGALLPAERRLVNSFDKYIRRPRLHRHGLAVTRERMVRMRKLIWLAVHREVERGAAADAAWRYRRRAQRYAILMSRTRGLG